MRAVQDWNLKNNQEHELVIQSQISNYNFYPCTCLIFGLYYKTCLKASFYFVRYKVHVNQARSSRQKLAIKVHNAVFIMETEWQATPHCSPVEASDGSGSCSTRFF